MKPILPSPTPPRLPAAGLALLAGLVLASYAGAQQTATTPASGPAATPAQSGGPTGANASPAPAPATSEEVDEIVLSPFEVNSEKDNGFMATNAGTATKRWSRRGKHTLAIPP